jgi:hypothetical protein
MEGVRPRPSIALRHPTRCNRGRPRRFRPDDVSRDIAGSSARNIGLRHRPVACDIDTSTVVRPDNPFERGSVRADERARPVHKSIVRAEFRTLAAVIRLVRGRPGGDRDRVLGIVHVEHPSTLAAVGAIVEVVLDGGDQPIAVGRRQRRCGTARVGSGAVRADARTNWTLRLFEAIAFPVGGPRRSR